MPETEKVSTKAPRSVRCNNPGNIERGDPWQGLADDQTVDDRFAVFKAPKWGFRALARTLITYYDKHKKDTVSKVIRRWAPPNENQTEAYIAAVCRFTKFLPNQQLDLHSYEHLKPLAKAIAIHEAGGWFFEDKDLDEGLRLAGVEPPPKALSQSRTMQAVSAGGTATIGVAAVSETLEQIEPALTISQQLAAYWPTVGLVILIIALGAVAYFRWDDWKEARR